MWIIAGVLKQMTRRTIVGAILADSHFFTIN